MPVGELVRLLLLTPISRLLTNALPLFAFFQIFKMSMDLQWLLIRNQNSFLVKRLPGSA